MSSTIARGHPPPLHEVFHLMESVVEIGLTSFVAVLGVVTNIINIIVFSQIGILFSSNIVSLSAMAVSDLIICLFVLWGNICLVVINFYNNHDNRWDIQSFRFSSFRHTFTQITCWITAYVAMERFFAIVFPFKVKTIFTAKHSLIAVCCIYIVMLGVDYPAFILSYPQWAKNPTNNVSILTFAPMKIDNIDIMIVASSYTYVSLRLISFTIVVICNITMVCKLSSLKFRKTKPTRASIAPGPSTFTTNNDTFANTSTIEQTSSSAPDKPDETMKTDLGHKTRPKVDRNRKLVSMMSVVCTLFIICSTPDIFTTVIFDILPFYFPIQYDPLIKEGVHILCSLLEAINSSCNIFIYYAMSSQFRRQFLQCWGRLGQ